MLFTSSVCQARNFKVYGWGRPAEKEFELVVSDPDVEEGVEFEYVLSLSWRAAAPAQIGLELHGGISGLTISSLRKSSGTA